MQIVVMLLPGSKGWINKYFSLVEAGEIELTFKNVKSLSSRHQLHLLSGKSGIVFGHATKFLFFSGEESKKWTEEEKVKLLLFETLLLAHLQKNGRSEDLRSAFLDELLTFYSKCKIKSIQSTITFWIKEGRATQVEHILASRVDISKGIFDNRWWFKTMSNVFIYLDVILFNRFLSRGEVNALGLYNEYAYNALISILLAGNADGFIDSSEEVMIKAFMSSANLEGELKEKMASYLKYGAETADFSNLSLDDKLFCRYLLDLAILTVFRSDDVMPSEVDYVHLFSKELLLSDIDVEESLAIVEHFLLYSDVKQSFLANKRTYERVYSNFTARWSKVILRNKDKLAVELSQSKELVSLIKKSALSELTNEEKDKVKSQFLDIVKSVPALAIFMLPGGAILLPLILKVLPTLIPSAFRDNEVEK